MCNDYMGSGGIFFNCRLGNTAIPVRKGGFAGSKSTCGRRFSGRSGLAFGAQNEFGTALAGNGILRHNDLRHVLSAGDFKHSVEENAFNDGAQAARARAMLQSLARDGA